MKALYLVLIMIAVYVPCWFYARLRMRYGYKEHVENLTGADSESPLVLKKRGSPEPVDGKEYP